MDLHWISSEAKTIHTVFATSFYSIITCLLVLGIVLNYFKMPIGHVPESLTLVGRSLVAALILAAFPEIMNALADFTDHIAHDIGRFNNIYTCLGRLGDKVGKLTWSWVSIKDSTLLILSYLSFAVLWVTVYLIDAIYVFTWALLYILSPLLIAAFVLPSTAIATKGLFRSLFEVCCWKVMWSVFATLLWSFALSEINKPGYDVDFVTAIIINLLLMLSLVSTPAIVSKLLNGGVHALAASNVDVSQQMNIVRPSTIAAAGAGLATGRPVAAMSALRKSQDQNHDKTRPAALNQK